MGYKGFEGLRLSHSHKAGKASLRDSGIGGGGGGKGLGFRV